MSNRSTLVSLSERSSWIISASSVIFAISSLFLITTVLEGPIRYFLSLKSLAPLAYSPKILMALATVSVVARKAKLLGPFMVGTMVLISVLWGMVNLSSIQQPLFGAWIAVPLLYGLTAGRFVFIDASAYHRLLIILYSIAAIGIFLSPFSSFPWSGSELNIGGKAVQVSRQWTVMGIDRYAGFARASFNAASQVLIISTILVLTTRSRLFSIFIWITSGAAIALTTAKGPAAAWIVLTVFFISRLVIGRSGAWRILWSAVLSGTAFAVVAAPVSALLYQYAPEVQSSTNTFLFASFGERLTWMWPASFRLLETPLAWLLGRGLGGVGAAQLYFEPQRYLAGDNLFVYLSVLIGPFASLMLLVTLVKVNSLNFVHKIMPVEAFAVVLCIMLYGLVANIIEDPFLAFFLGATVTSKIAPRQRHSGGLYVARKFSKRDFYEE